GPVEVLELPDREPPDRARRSAGGLEGQRHDRHRGQRRPQARRGGRAQPRMKVWAILGAHQGDNNQVLALAEALGGPFTRKQLTYNRWRHLGPRILGASLRSLTKRSRTSVSRDLPDLTISTGHRSVAVVQALRARSPGMVRSVHVGYPRISPGKFDL